MNRQLFSGFRPLMLLASCYHVSVCILFNERCNTTNAHWHNKIYKAAQQGTSDVEGAVSQQSITMHLGATAISKAVYTIYTTQTTAGKDIYRISTIQKVAIIQSYRRKRRGPGGGGGTTSALAVKTSESHHTSCSQNWVCPFLSLRTQSCSHHTTFRASAFFEHKCLCLLLHSSVGLMGNRSTD